MRMVSIEWQVMRIVTSSSHTFLNIVGFESIPIQLGICLNAFSTWFHIKGHKRVNIVQVMTHVCFKEVNHLKMSTITHVRQSLLHAS